MRWLQIFIAHVGVVAGDTFDPELIPESYQEAGRQYSEFTLSNGIAGVVVHVPTAGTGAVSVAVNSGSFEDPAHMQGAAHLTGRMLFLGSAEYPGRSNFDDFMSKHGGDSKAITQDESTVFYGRIDQEEAIFKEFLHRFAAFFVSPTLSADDMAAEAMAVHEEHEKDKPNPNNQLGRIVCLAANPESASAKFRTGNQHTLMGESDSNDRLRKFFNKHYGAQNLKLVIESKHSVETMKSWAKQYFSKIPKRGSHAVTIVQKQNEFTELGKYVYVHTLSAETRLWLHFPLDPFDDYLSLANIYLKYMLAYEGPNGLAALLMKENLIHSLAVELQHSRKVCSLIIKLKVTTFGKKNLQRILWKTFSYLDKLRKAPVDVNIYKAIGKLQQYSFDTSDQSDPLIDVAFLAERLTRYPAKHVMVAENLLIKPNVQLIQTILAKLTATNVNMYLSDPNYESGQVDEGFDEYYSFLYTFNFFPSNKYSAANDDTLLPDASFVAHIPVKGALQEDSAGETPQVVVSDPSLNVYWFGHPSHGKIHLPHTANCAVQVLIRMPVAGTTPEMQLAGKIVAAMLTTVLAEEQAVIRFGGRTDVTVTSTFHGLQFTFTGGRKTIKTLIQNSLKSFLNIKVHLMDTSKFARVKERLQLSLMDIVKTVATELSIDILRYMIKEHAVYRASMITDLPPFPAHSCEDYIHLIVEGDAKVEVLVGGNLDSTDAGEIGDMLRSTLNLDSRGELKLVNDRDLKYHNLELRCYNPIPRDKNSVVVSTRVCMLPDDRQKVTMMILKEMLHAEANKKLRIEQEIGYIAGCSLERQFNGPWGIAIYLQSASTSTEKMSQSIRDLFSAFPERLNTLDSADFESWRHGVKVELASPPQNEADLAHAHWDKIVEGSVDFGLENRLADLADSITIDEVKSVFTSCLQAAPVTVQLLARTRHSVQWVIEPSLLPAFKLQARRGLELWDQLPGTHTAPVAQSGRTYQMPLPQAMRKLVPHTKSKDEFTMLNVLIMIVLLVVIFLVARFIRKNRKQRQYRYTRLTNVTE